jgi:hypothetical protein
MRTFENEEKGYTLEASFYWDGIRWDTLEQMIKTMKLNEDFTWEYVRWYYLDLQTDEEEYLALVDECEQLWHDENVKPWTATEVFALQNQEQKYLLLSMIGADKIESEMEPTLVDRQVLTKQQPRYAVTSKGEHKLRDRFKKSELIESSTTYEDIYELYKFDKSKLETNNDVYFVKCKDTSTDRVYYIYVDGRDERCNRDAISAIAWTMRDPDGEPFTKEMYLQLKAEA